ncbi:MAG: HAMP domain-containing protein [Candidatus Omnitrophica bacterium]|nr:HAMP domain-containing protein [Candidatus Omnitrophota bacterium]
MRSIRSKLIFWICILFVFIGASIYLPLSKILPQKITSQILKRDAEIARHISGEAKDLLLLGDRVALSILLRENLKRLEDARYLYIRDMDGDVLSHTFSKGFPKGLLSLNVDIQATHGIEEFISSGIRIYDIAIPILDGQLGTLHMGVSMESGKEDIAEITRINYYVGAVILTGMAIGILVFLVIGFLFSRQIIKLKDFASKVGSGDLDAKTDVKSNDEIGALASTFNEMATRLKEKISQIKKLNTVEERNRIAIDLHDGCAQDLANIIKRLELCERFFEIDPQKGFEELAILKESTRDVLNRTRRVIFDLKSPEDATFNLLDNLNRYIKDYHARNEIMVKLDISGPMDDIPSDKAKKIFYIIAEALTNIRKHAHAKNVRLNLRADGDGRLAIYVKDDGRGFDAGATPAGVTSRGGLGLISMRQRASSLGGSFLVDSALQGGTAVYVEIPLAADASKETNTI